MNNSSKNAAELEIEDIEGVGPTTARKMKEAGISSVMELATAVADELATDLGGSKETAATFIMAAQKLLRESGVLDNEFTTASTRLAEFSGPMPLGSFRTPRMPPRWSRS